MTNDSCRDWRGALGAAAIGRTDPAEEVGLLAHLDGCPACRAELLELTAVAHALSTIPVDVVTSAPAEPAGALAERVLERVAKERVAVRSRRTRRVLVGAGAFASAAAVVVAAVLVFGGPEPSAGTKVVLSGNAGASASASATLHAAAVGTQVDVKVAGLHPGHYYWLWVTGDDGHRIAAGTFSGVRRPTEIRLMAALPLTEARRIWVTDDKRKVVLDAILRVQTRAT